MTSNKATQWFLSDDDVWDRLKELCTSSSDILSEAVSGAFIHLVWVGESAELLVGPLYRPSFIMDTEEPSHEEILSTFDSLVKNLSTHSKNIGRGVKLPLADWNDSVELLFYCKLLAASLDQPRHGSLQTLDSVIREFLALQHFPLRLIGLVAYATYNENELRSNIDPDLMPDAIIPWAIHGTAAWGRTWAEKRRLEMGMVEMLVSKSYRDIEFEPAKGVSSQNSSRDTVLELIEKAFEKKPTQLRNGDGMTYVWLLEQMLSISIERGYLLRSFGEVDPSRMPDLLGEREKRCMKVLPRCLQAMRNQYTSPVHLGKILEFQDKFVQVLSPFATGTRVYSDEDILLSPSLEIRDLLSEERRWWGTEDEFNKHKQAYSRLRAAVDRIRSNTLKLENSQRTTEATVDPLYAPTSDGRVGPSLLTGGGISEQVAVIY
ncbi:hypothetical protein FRC01_012003 [Tulasnella sp. 417]|nr:hypothetical protein FRC01_012003 [Tulasnella sp. 417]